MDVIILQHVHVHVHVTCACACAVYCVRFALRALIMAALDVCGAIGDSAA